MKITRTENNQINFGLNYNTHRKIAEKLIKEEFPKLQNYSPVIKKAVVDPDFDELGFHSNTHFYFPFDNWLKPRASFLDIDGSHNAYVKYTSHVGNSLEALKRGQFPVMAEEIGRAKHFLDDMCVGLHVKQGNFIQKWREMPVHAAFENFIHKHEDELIAKSSRSVADLKSDTFEDIFVSVVGHSKNTEMPTKDNVLHWDEIAQDTINLVLDSSRLFFAKVSDLLR